MVLLNTGMRGVLKSKLANCAARRSRALAIAGEWNAVVIGSRTTRSAFLARTAAAASIASTEPEIMV